MRWVNYGLKGGWDTGTGGEEDVNRLGAWLGAMAQANKDQGAEAAPPASDLRTAEAPGRRVATVTQQLGLGRRATMARAVAGAYVAVLADYGSAGPMFRSPVRADCPPGVVGRRQWR